MKDKKRILGLAGNSCAKSYSDIRSKFSEICEVDGKIFGIGRIS